MLDIITKNFSFPSFRPYQRETIQQIIEAWEEKKYVIVEAPTGFGKAETGKSACLTYKELHDADLDDYTPYGSILVHTRFLQTQYERDKIPVVWSNSHYACDAYVSEDIHFGHWMCQKAHCRLFSSCAYVKARKAFSAGPVGCTNFSYYLTNEEITSKILVIDEAHRFESVLCDFFSVNFSREQWKGQLKVLLEEKLCLPENIRLLWEFVESLLQAKDKYYQFSSQLDESLSIVMDLVSTLDAYLRDLRRQSNIRQHDRERIDKLFQLLLFLQKVNDYLFRLGDSEIVWIRISPEKGKEEQEISYKPLQIDTLAQRVFSRAEKILFLSATICGHELFSKVLGLDPEETEFISVPRIFPQGVCQIIFSPETVSFNFKNRRESIKKIAEQMLLLCQQFPEVRGIVHSVSYDNARQLQKDLSKQNADIADRFLVVESESVLEITNLLLEKPNRILISPSIMEGVDLRDDLCRLVFFMKCPWPSLGNEWVCARRDQITDWYLRETIIAMIQGCGRATRHEDDISVVILMDEQFQRLLRDKKTYIPDWFLENLKV